MDRQFIRECSGCKTELKYSQKSSLNRANKANSLCGVCAKLGKKNPGWGVKRSNETRKRMSDAQRGEKNGMFGKHRTEEVKRKIGESLRGHKVSENCRMILSKRMYGNENPAKNPESRKRMSISKQMENHPFFGKKLSEEHRKKLSMTKIGEKNPCWRKPRSIETKIKIGRANTGKKLTRENIEKLRLIAIKRIEKNKFNGSQIIPGYNPTAIPILEQKAKELGITDLQHAENGGEYCIKELGYWVDGYSKEKNIVIEIDEKHHYIDGKLREKDIYRQEEIKKFLGCNFIRIKI